MTDNSIGELDRFPCDHLQGFLPLAGVDVVVEGHELALPVGVALLVPGAVQAEHLGLAPRRAHGCWRLCRVEAGGGWAEECWPGKSRYTATTTTTTTLSGGFPYNIGCSSNVDM